METYDESVDADSIHSSERDSWDDELDDDGSYSVSSADKSSTDGNNDADEVGGDNKVRFDTITAEEIRCMEFATVSEAYDFYYRYGKYNGFAVRKSDSRVTGSGDNKVIKMKQFVCNRHGVREKRHLVRTDRKLEHRRLTRTQCGARLRVNYKAEKDRYVVTAFEETHNHELTPARFVHLHPVYRKISETDKAQVDGLQKRGIRTCHIMGYMVAQKGGYAGVGFTKKDLYNYFDKKMRAVIKDGDVAASLNYLNMKSSTDPMLYAEYAVDNINGRMNTLFWADGISRTDYFCFGDVLAFDTTYSKNKYNYPLVIFSGCNHHSQTVIFGAALVSNETTETYKWVLRCFLECMEGKQPKAVVTDGDGAMREAIKQIFPDANHRLCAWHLNKNAGENVKNGNNFLDGFSKAMYSNFTIDEFEEYWSHMIKENGVQGHPWVVKTYENRSLWATAYLRDNFFGRIRTTSQCEAVNAIIKSYVRKKGCIFEFMNNFDQALRDYRNNELVADFKSSSTDPVLSTQLPVIESHAGKIYTAAVFKEVRHEILKAGELIVRDKSEVGGTKIYILTRFCKDDYERSVAYDGSTFKCSCKRFESRGIPCSHIFYVMKEEHVDRIPDNLVLSRWTKDAKIQYLNISNCNDNVDSNTIAEARFGSYCTVLTDFCREASKKDGVYAQIMEDLMQLKIKYCNNDDAAVGTQKSAVGDPVMVKSKGAPKKKKNDTKAGRRRSKCKHTTPNARRYSGTQQTSEQAPEPNVDMYSVSISDSVSQIAEKKKRKASCNGQKSVQNKSLYDPTTYRGANVMTTTQVEVPTTSIGIHQQMFPMQSMMPMVHPMMQQMHMQPMYPMYGMQPGMQSGMQTGLLQQVIRSSKNN
ncbi:unnamed protein product [Trifolium pratense]|uniref:Uncharacterized protein n=2 Tax=Trifolium pratense TaxID=57577 RepID=A0ACB0M8M9_TRIPR|nr:unnamed protein product [Trifolium pratense]CAJ2676749.1 unnamed protein product [Trifolium pratense]